MEEERRPPYVLPFFLKRLAICDRSYTRPLTVVSYTPVSMPVDCLPRAKHACFAQTMFQPGRKRALMEPNRFYFPFRREHLGQFTSRLQPRNIKQMRPSTSAHQEMLPLPRFYLAPLRTSVFYFTRRGLLS